jgi:bacterioferritin-associated ferredoxin
MYVCVCLAVTERQIHEAASEGARCLKDLRHRLGVTKECGRCASCAHACLREAQQRIGEETTLPTSSKIFSPAAAPTC